MPWCVTLIPVSRPVLTLAAELRADEGLALADAIHIATAIDQGCSSFVTAADETLAHHRRPSDRHKRFIGTPAH